MVVRYAVTSLRRHVVPVALAKRVSLWVGEQKEAYTVQCGPAPQVSQGEWPGADLRIEMDVPSFRDFFFRQAEPIGWLGRTGVTLKGELGALEVLRASFPGTMNEGGRGLEVGGDGRMFPPSIASLPLCRSPF